MTFPTLSPAQRANLEARWRAKTVLPSSGGASCWTWIGGKDSHGYGQISVRGRNVLAHRVSWRLFRGELPDGMSVLHTCNRGHLGCVTPTHLYLGTQRDNVRDMVRARHLGTAKVTAEQARAIRADGRNYRAIAEQYGISRSAVCLIKKRKNWGHLS